MKQFIIDRIIFPIIISAEKVFEPFPLSNIETKLLNEILIGQLQQHNRI